MKRTFAAVILSLALMVMLAPGHAEPAEVDLDLSAMPASVAYAQALAMQRDPDDYAGQRVRVAGIFNYSEARERGVIIVADKTGCCETFFDFICADALAYPDDYPDLYARFVLVGRFEPSDDEVGGCYLADAVIEAP